MTVQNKILKSYRSIPYEVAKERLNMWLDANAAVATGQSYTIGSRSLTRANLNDIQSQIEYWSSIVTKCESGHKSIYIQRVIPQDF